MMLPRDPFLGKNSTWWVNDPLRSISKSAEQTNKSRNIASLQITAHIFWRFPNGKERTIWFSNLNFRFSNVNASTLRLRFGLAFRCYFRELARTLNLTLRSRNRPFWTCWTKEDWLMRYSANNIDDCRSVSDRFFLARVCESNWVDMSSCTGSSRVWWRNVTRTLPGNVFDWRPG